VSDARKPAREPLITPAELAEILQVSINTARKIMREEGAISVGAQLRWTVTKLERFLRAGGTGHTAPRSRTDHAAHQVRPSTPDDADDIAPFRRPIVPRTVPRDDKSSATSRYLRPIVPHTVPRGSRPRKRK
jgi:hypothetical protein